MSLVTLVEIYVDCLFLVWELIMAFRGTAIWNSLPKTLYGAKSVDEFKKIIVLWDVFCVSMCTLYCINSALKVNSLSGLMLFPWINNWKTNFSHAWFTLWEWQHNYCVIFSQSLQITLWAFIAFQPNLVPRCALTPLFCVPYFKTTGQLTFTLWWFHTLRKKKKKTKKAERLYLGNAWHNLVEFFYFLPFPAF